MAEPIVEIPLPAALLARVEAVTGGRVPVAEFVQAAVERAVRGRRTQRRNEFTLAQASLWARAFLEQYESALHVLTAGHGPPESRPPAFDLGELYVRAHLAAVSAYQLTCALEAVAPEALASLDAEDVRLIRNAAEHGDDRDVYRSTYGHDHGWIVAYPDGVMFGAWNLTVFAHRVLAEVLPHLERTRTDTDA